MPPISFTCIRTTEYNAKTFWQGKEYDTNTLPDDTITELLRTGYLAPTE